MLTPIKEQGWLYFDLENKNPDSDTTIFILQDGLSERLHQRGKSNKEI